MKALFSKVMALPLPFKGLLCMVIGGGIYGILWAAGFKRIAVLMGIAIAVLGAVLALVGFIMERRDKSKAKEVEAKVAENSAATPGGVNKVADRARLDDLRRQFETGIQTFRDYGKDLYSMPWYVIVGEPGSGKTEAVRHSGIGFPPGLQDQLQGTGGTVNMNWWFTDHAVVLDTAGRLMFEDVAPGETNEWREFLKLLRTVRQNCPINGMLLVIPADTLITDTADEIEKKSGKIAQQFDQIQRSLGVRFPVFVLVTKSDLINGFREFFDDITDPVLTAQMLGWSNPAGLDEAFRPDRVEEHLATVRNRLLQRRLALLQDPIHTKDPKGRRIDQVDALYKFPEALTEIGPRLRRYLETIFVAGEWSQKPLFLRGIYFTSSMREGDALDADLANALGVGVESLPEGKLWERERSYFLRDVFLDKVFKERGLVTRAVNAGQVKRKRSFIMVGAGLATALILSVMLWYSWSETKRRISDPRDFWTSVKGWVEQVADGDGDRTMMTPEELRYLSAFFVTGESREFYGHENIAVDEVPLQIEGRNRTYDELFARARQHYENNRTSRGLFALIANLPGVGGSDVFGKQLPAQRELFESLLLAPAVTHARDDLLGRSPYGPADWGADAIAPAVLSSMLSLEVDAVLRRDRTDRFDGERFTQLVRFVVGKGRAGVTDPRLDESREGALDRLAGYYDWLYSQEKAWPPATLAAGSERAVAAVEAGLDAFIARWRDPSGEGTVYGQLRAFVTAAEAFGEAENRLQLAAAFNTAATIEQYREHKSDWLARHAELERAAAELRQTYGPVSAMFGATDLTERAQNAIWASAEASYDELLAAFGGEDDLRADREAHARLVAWRDSLRDAKNKASAHYRELASSLVAKFNGEIRRDFVARPAGATSEAFEVRLDMYEIAKRALMNDGAPAGALVEAFDVVRRDEQAGIGEFQRRMTQDGHPFMTRTGDVGQAIVRAAARHSRNRAIDAAMARIMAFESDFQRIERRRLPEIRFTTLDSLDYPPDFQPEANRDLLSGFALIGGQLRQTNPDGSPLVLDTAGLGARLGEVQSRLAGHARNYVRFWAVTVPDRLKPTASEGLTFSDFHSALRNDAPFIAERVREFGAEIRGALSHAEAFLDEQTGARAYFDAARREEADRDGIASRWGGMLTKWRELGGNTRLARETMLIAAEGTRFLDDYFPLRTPVGTAAVGPEQSYWNELGHVGLQTLARESSGENERLVQRAERNSRRFPVSVDAEVSSALSLDEIRAIHEALRDLSLPTGDRDDPRAERDVFDGYPDRIATQLKLLRGDSLARDRSRADRLRRSREVSAYLLDNAGRIGFTLCSLGYNYEPNQPTRDLCRQVKINAGGRVVTASGSEYRKIDEHAELIRDYEFNAPLTDDLQMSFIGRAEGAQTVSARVTSWEALASLKASSPVNRRDVDGAEADVWPLPLRLDNGRVFYIGVQFKDAAALATLQSRWPRVADWPRE